MEKDAVVVLSVYCIWHGNRYSSACLESAHQFCSEAVYFQDRVYLIFLRDCLEVISSVC